MSAQKDLEGLGSYEASCRFREIAEALDRARRHDRTGGGGEGHVSGFVAA